MGLLDLGARAAGVAFIILGVTGAGCGADLPGGEGVTATSPAPPPSTPSDTPTSDGGAPDAPFVPGVCGNGKVEPGEACDDGKNDLLGGGCKPGCKAMDTTDEVFAPKLRVIEITLPPSDWELLRHETKSRHVIFGGADCRTRPIVAPYTWHTASVRIDGEAFSQVAVRKKGHIGSQATRRPSLKVDFDKLVPGRKFHGMDRFSIDNNKSDPTLAHTSTAYQLFAAAGIPAPRTTQAHVLVNGESQGVYTLHEEIEKDFLARHFADASGNLYEGTANDFRAEFVGGFERETNEADTSRADIDRVMAAMAKPDGELVAALDKLIDLDAFFRFWAAEVLVWHRDGYSGNSNNFFIYADPRNGGRFRWLPWGVDATFNTNTAPAVPDSVLAFSAITQRLYAIPAARERYYAALDDLLAKAWDPAKLAARVAAIGATADTVLSAADQTARAAAAANMTTMILNRSTAIAAARAGGAPAWTEPMRSLPCRILVGKASGTFSTTWGTIAANVFSSGTGSIVLDVDGGTTATTSTGSRAGTGTGAPRLQIIGDAEGRRYTMTVPYYDTKWFDPFTVTGPQRLVSPPASFTLVETDITVSPAVTLRRFEVGEGTWTFTAASMTDTGPVTGSFTGGLYLVP